MHADSDPDEGISLENALQRLRQLDPQQPVGVGMIELTAEGYGDESEIGMRAEHALALLETADPSGLIPAHREGRQFQLVRLSLPPTARR
jgi:hypothetical protein